MSTPTSSDIASVIRKLLRERGVGKSICPSEAARVLATGAGIQEWRVLMPAVRDQARRLALRGEVVVTQQGEMVDMRQAHGPVRIALASPKLPR